jgi:hypothetical protein
MPTKDYYNIDNVKVPSVTTILTILSKPRLISWANRQGFLKKNVDETLDESANRGILVHSLIENYLMKPSNEPILIQDQFVYNALLNFIEWRSVNSINPILQEASFSSKNFGGTLDLYCELNGKLTLMDFKTSKDIYLSHFIQLSGYILLLEENGYKVEQAGILLVNDNICNIKLISRDIMNEYIELFRITLYLFTKYNSVSKNSQWGEEFE